MDSSNNIDSLKPTQLTSKLRQERSTYSQREMLRGNKIVDIAYFKELDGSYGIDLTILDYNNSIIHLYYLKPDKNPISDQFYLKQIQVLQHNIKSMYGADISALQKDLTKDNQMLSSLYDSDKISLAVLEENAKAAELDGFNVDDVSFYLLIPGNSSVSIDDREKDDNFEEKQKVSSAPVNQILSNYNTQKDEDLKSLDSDNGTYISGSEGTSNATFNQIIGVNCDYYKVFQTSSGELSIIGFRNGTPQKIDNTFLRNTSFNNNSITMLQNDGSIAERDLVGCYKIGVTDQYIGLYMDGNKLSICYARDGEDNLIGKDISESSIHSSTGMDISDKLDMAKNRDLTAEDKTAAYVSDVKYIGPNSSPSNRDSDDLIPEIADEYNVDAVKLQEDFDNSRPQYSNISDEDLATQLAQQQAQQSEPQNDENNEDVQEEPSKEEDDDNHWPGERVLGGNNPPRPPIV